MLKINIAGTEFEYLKASETEKWFNGAFRRALTVTCLPNAISMDELNSVLTEENLANITLSSTDTGIIGIYDGYVLKLKLGIENKLIQPETSDTPAAYDDRLIFELGKRTYTEEQLRKLAL